MRSVDDSTFTFKPTLLRLPARGLCINPVIGVGEFSGAWSPELAHFVPPAEYPLIEANSDYEPTLKHFCQDRPNASYVLTGAGGWSGEICFDGSDPLGGLAVESQSHAATTRVRCVSIDDSVADLDLDGPILMELDTDGFELPIIRGTEVTIAAAEALVIEYDNFRIAPDCTLSCEIGGYLDECGFRCIDVFDPLYRAGDRAFLQCDRVFVRRDLLAFTHTAYCDNTRSSVASARYPL